MTLEDLAEKLEHEDLIDPETGELIERDQTEGAEPLTPDHLPKLARRIRHDTRRLEMIRKFRKDELARIGECCDHRIAALEAQIAYCTETLAKPLVAGRKLTEFPGIGTFKLRDGREYVDDEAYQKMTQEEQTRVQSQHPGCFKHKTTITPIKNEIKVRLEDFRGGQSEADVEGFEIKRHPETFKFEPEEDV